jgi:hypothetical protein
MENLIPMDPESLSDTTRWKIVTDKENFDKLKTKESFWSIVALGRAVNALFFVHQAIVAHEGDTSPAAVRASHNSVLFSCGILFESFRLVQNIGKYFSDVPEFKALSALMNSKEARKILESDFSKLRNTLVFHFDPAEAGRQLENLELTEPTFTSAQGKTNGQTYCELSDICAFRTLYGPTYPGSDTLLAESEFTRSAAWLIVDFSNLAQDLIQASLTATGWFVKVLPDASGEISSAAPAAESIP